MIDASRCAFEGTTQNGSFLFVLALPFPSPLCHHVSILWATWVGTQSSVVTHTGLNLASDIQLAFRVQSSVLLSIHWGLKYHTGIYYLAHGQTYIKNSQSMGTLLHPFSTFKTWCKEYQPLLGEGEVCTLGNSHTLQKNKQEAFLRKHWHLLNPYATWGSVPPQVGELESWRVGCRWSGLTFIRDPATTASSNVTSSSLKPFLTLFLPVPLAQEGLKQAVLCSLDTHCPHFCFSFYYHWWSTSWGNFPIP